MIDTLSPPLSEIALFYVINVDNDLRRRFSYQSIIRHPRRLRPSRGAIQNKNSLRTGTIDFTYLVVLTDRSWTGL